MLKIFDTSDFRIFSTSNQPASNAVRKLAAFKNLPDGWNYGRDRPIRNDVYEFATILLSIHSTLMMEAPVPSDEFLSAMLLNLFLVAS